MRIWRQVRRISRKYGAVAAQSARNRLAYPKDLLGRAIFLVLILFVYDQLWRRVLGARGDFAGFSRTQLTWYMAFTEGIGLSIPRLQGIVSEDVKTGNIAYRLNRPLSYLGQTLAEFAGEMALNVAATLACAAGMAWLLTGSAPMPTNIAVLVVLVLLGALISFFIAAALALTAFWVEDNGPFFWVYSKINFVLAGLFIPVEVYPGFLRSFAEFLPFRLVYAGAARLAVRYDAVIAGRIFMAQIVWLAPLMGIAVLVYRKGVRKLNVNGG